MHTLSSEIATLPSAQPVRASPVCAALVRATLRLYTLACMRTIHVQKEAPWPAGPKLIAANHANCSDGFALPFVFGEPLVALVQADLFALPVLGRWLAGAGWVPVTAGQAGTVLTAARQRLLAGQALVIFPEGRLNHGGPLFRGKTGAVRLALQTGAPIVPVGCYVPEHFARMFQGAKAGRPTRGRWQMGGPLHVAVGAALWPQRLADGDHSYKMQRALTDDLMARIAALVARAQREAER